MCTNTQVSQTKISAKTEEPLTSLQWALTLQALEAAVQRLCQVAVWSVAKKTSLAGKIMAHTQVILFCNESNECISEVLPTQRPYRTGWRREDNGPHGLNQLSLGTWMENVSASPHAIQELSSQKRTLRSPSLWAIQLLKHKKGG